VNDAFLGLNQALFVIGGKDAGKTHTFVGNVADPGKQPNNLINPPFQTRIYSY